MEYIATAILGIWLVSMVVEFVLLAQHFHSKYQVVFYAGTYLEMKTDLWKKAFKDAFSVVFIGNVILFFIVRAIAAKALGLFSGLLNVAATIMMVAGFGMLLIYGVLYYKEKFGENRAGIAFEKLERQDANLKNVVEKYIRSEQQRQKYQEEHDKEQAALDRILKKQEDPDDLLSEEEKALLEKYPSGKVSWPDDLEELTTAEKEILNANPQAVELYKKQDTKKEKGESYTSKSVLAWALIFIAMGMFWVHDEIDAFLTQGETEQTQTSQSSDTSDTYDYSPDMTASEYAEAYGYDPQMVYYLESKGYDDDVIRSYVDMGELELVYEQELSNDPDYAADAQATESPTPAPTAAPTPTPEPMPAQTEMPTIMPDIVTDSDSFAWGEDGVLAPIWTDHPWTVMIVTAEPVLNMRSGPGTEYDKIYQVPNGANVGWITSYDTSGEWGYIEYNDPDTGAQVYGWVAAEFVEGAF